MMIVKRRKNSTIPIVLFFIALLFSSAVYSKSDVNSEISFAEWLADLRDEALREGISAETVQHALTDLSVVEKVVALDRRQPEFTQTFWSYLDARITNWRIQRGKSMLKKHAKLLSEIEQQYGVPARYLVAFWGMETNYGNYLGNHSTIASLATLAYDPRRSTFFRKQLIDALRIIDQGHVKTENMVGSWAGAVGHLQFMPSTFLQYAADGDNDNRIDLWGNLPDVFSSGGFYLKSIGWRYGELWGREVRLPPDFNWQLATLKNRQTVDYWRSQGVSKADGRPLAKDKTLGAIILPQGAAGPAFLVYDNFDVIMDWNRSIKYAIAVGHLADRLIDLPELKGGRNADNRPLSFDAAKEMQQRLNELGFDAGTPDGIAGRKTREAVRSYQASTGRVADGFPSVSILEMLREQQGTGNAKE
ncbi:MAG: lytic murein transglycosylase [Gammaproteobacteria bacterium]|nr:lytic murein transglycosylase [Gammaproteobacteria bacterium]MCF6230343.1 lytic murein transglycosylase [Gammaproteobacteria bacterium]